MALDGFDWSGFGPQLDPTLALQQIRSMRYNALWERAMTCPNRISEERDHNLNCRICDGGIGWLYSAPVESKFLVTSISLRQQWALQGRFDAGMAMITGLPETLISWHDRITFLESKIRYTEAVRHDPLKGRIDALKYPIVDDNPNCAEDRGVIRLVKANGTEALIDVDFSITVGKQLEWAVDPGPIFYSVMYTIRPRYIILDLNHHMRTLPAFGPRGIGLGPGGMGEKTIAFPIMGVGKLDFLWGDESRIA